LYNYLELRKITIEEEKKIQLYMKINALDSDRERKALP
jgi:hypothetical protein